MAPMAKFAVSAIRGPVGIPPHVGFVFSLLKDGEPLVRLAYSTRQDAATARAALQKLLPHMVS